MQHPSEPATILIVEDDRHLGRALARVLTSDTQRPLLARTSRSAQRLLQKHAPRLVLLDASLREGTAINLLEKISENHRGLPIILLAAHRLDQSKLRGCVHQVVTKSINLRELRETVGAALGVASRFDLPKSVLHSGPHHSAPPSLHAIAIGH